MKVEMRMSFEEARNLLGLVRGKIVEDDMDLFVVWLAGEQIRQKRDELVAGMAGGCSAARTLP
jgi:hypothetical protein